VHAIPQLVHTSGMFHHLACILCLSCLIVCARSD
jgi:hypothetical protein